MRLRTSLGLFSIVLLLAACSGPAASNLPSLPARSASPAVSTAASPSSEATAEATAEATDEATAEPTGEATAEPTTEPTAEPTAEVTAEPTAEVTDAPTEVPTVAPPATLPPPLAVCGPIESLSTKTPGRLTLSTDIPAFPPWWGGDPESSTRTSRRVAATGRSAIRTPWRATRQRRPTPSRTRWASRQTRSTGSTTPVFEQAFAPGRQAVRLPHGPDLDPPKRALSGRLQRPVLRVEPGDPRADAERDHERSQHRRPEGLPARRGRQHDQLRSDRHDHPADRRTVRVSGQRDRADRHSRTARSTRSSST